MRSVVSHRIERRQRFLSARGGGERTYPWGREGRRGNKFKTHTPWVMQWKQRPLFAVLEGGGPPHLVTRPSFLACDVDEPAVFSFLNCSHLWFSTLNTASLCNYCQTWTNVNLSWHRVSITATTQSASSHAFVELGTRRTQLITASVLVWTHYYLPTLSSISFDPCHSHYRVN